jgi:hypothetical protein
LALREKTGVLVKAQKVFHAFTLSFDVIGGAPISLFYILALR